MFAVDMKFPRRDIDSLFAQINRAGKELNKSGKQSLAWAGALLCRSIAARTKQSPKLRPIVKNPDKSYKTDRRRAPFGVYVYRNGKKTFKPIFRTGESSGSDVANPELIVPGIKTDKRRVIGRRGLAKKTWLALARFMKRNGSVKTMDVDSGHIQRKDDGLLIIISNKLNYAKDAFKGDINQAVGAATRALAYKIDKAIDKKMLRGRS